MYRVYLITNQVNNKIYIGQTKESVERRFKRHVASAFGNFRWSDTHFCRAIRKYSPEAFIMKTIDVADSRDEIFELEKMYIRLFRSNEIGYNSTPGGDGVSVKELNETDYAKWRESQSKAIWNNPEWRKKHSIRMSGKNSPLYGKKPPNTKLHIPDEEVVRLYTEENLGLVDVGEKVGLNQGTVSYRLKRLGIPRRKQGDRISGQRKQDGQNNGNWREDVDNDVLKSLYYEGISAAKLSEMFNMHRSSIERRLKSMDVVTTRIPTTEKRKEFFLKNCLTGEHAL